MHHMQTKYSVPRYLQGRDMKGWMSSFGKMPVGSGVSQMIQLGNANPIGGSITEELVLGLFLKRGSYAVDRVLKRGTSKKDGCMRDAPHRFQRGRIIGQPWNDVPMDVGELIA